MSSEPNHTPPRLPALACDSHFHVFGPAARFPYAPERSYTPDDAPFESALAMHAALGLQRGVIVQPACHGYDMSATLDALQRGRGQYRAIALAPADISLEQLQAFDAQGVRGVRFNFMPHLSGGPGIEDMAAMGRKIEALGWHLCIHTNGAALPGLLKALKHMPVPYVIDHMGRVDVDEGTQGAAFQALLELASVPDAWVKVSGIDRLAGGHAPYSAGRAFVSALLEAMPERVLWGTDWPHPNVAGPVPDDADLLDIFLELCPDAGLREQVLVRNPDTLYRFDPVAHASA